ncbi:hypothetical protein BY996DRAFT_6669175 [Phakopsora pachyrhizi]|nr:hypothetical protein BY996DRAFT_6669175 [Phakopsora pachyrhizi]
MSPISSDRSLQDDIKNLFKLLPPGVNPFEFIIKYLYEKNFPPTSNASIIVLKIFFSFHLLICFFCISILILPFFKGKRDSMWVFKKLYISDGQNLRLHPSPLYFLNSGMIMAISQFFGSVSSVLYILLLLRSSKDTEYRAKAKSIKFLSPMLNFEFFAYWVMAWNSLYTKLYSGAFYTTNMNSKQRCTVPPFIYNFLFVTFPFISIFIDVYYLKILMDSMSQQSSAWFDLLENLKVGSKIWEDIMEPSTDTMKHANLMNKIMENTNKSEVLARSLLWSLDLVVERFRNLCITWTIVLFITCVLFIYSLWSFLSLIYQSIRPKFPKPANNIPVLTCSRNKTKQQNQFLTQAEVPVSPQIKIIRQKLRFLTFRASVMVFSISISIIICMIGSITPVRIATDPSWRSIMCWVPLISGSIASLPITYQCWRLCNDGEEIHKSAHKRLASTTDCLDYVNAPRGNDISASIISIQPSNPATSSELSAAAEEFPLEDVIYVCDKRVDKYNQDQIKKI